MSPNTRPLSPRSIPPWRAERAHAVTPLYGAPCFRVRQEKPLSRGADCDFLDFAADEGLVFAEIGLEALGQTARGLVIGLLVGPGAARVEHLVRHLGAAFRHEEAEIRLLADGRRGEAAVERGAQQGAGMGDRHAPPGAISAARPAGIDEPALRPMLANQGTQHLGID